jgi:hypothetical protein
MHLRVKRLRKMIERIFILGAGKSGTTGLFALVYASLYKFAGIAPARLFEPRDVDRLDKFKPDFGVTKVLLERFIRFERTDFIKKFNKKIIIIRDPRDVIVSRLIWIIATRLYMINSIDAKRIIRLLEQKQANPDSISIYKMFDEISLIKPNAAHGARKFAYLPAEVIGKLSKSFFILNYEKFIDLDFDDLEKYLNFPIVLDGAASEIIARFSHVKRRAAYGDWKSWFLAEDYEFFVDEAGMRALGYEPSVYKGPRSIGYEETVGYVRRLKPVRDRYAARDQQATTSAK